MKGAALVNCPPLPTDLPSHFPKCLYVQESTEGQWLKIGSVGQYVDAVDQHFQFLVRLTRCECCAGKAEIEYGKKTAFSQSGCF